MTDEVGKRSPSRSLSDHLSEKRLYPSYQIFKKMREYYAENEDGPELSNVYWARVQIALSYAGINARATEQRRMNPAYKPRLRGAVAVARRLQRRAQWYSAKPQFLPVGSIFLAKEEKQNVRLYGSQCLRCGTRQYPITRVCIACQNHDSLQEVPLERTGQVFTFTRDHLYVAADSPTIMAVIDVNHGGRLYIQMTDVDPEDVRVGDEVVLTLRRRKEGPTMHHYYWKCRPAR